MEKLAAALNEGKSVRQVGLNAEEAEIIKGLGLLTNKPIIYAANVSEEDLATGNDFVEKVREVAAVENAQVVIVSAQVEAELVELPEADKADFLESLGVKEGGLKSLIRATYTLLGLRTYFTCKRKPALGQLMRECLHLKQQESFTLILNGDLFGRKLWLIMI